MPDPDRRRMAPEDRAALVGIGVVLVVVFAIAAFLVKAVASFLFGAASFAGEGIGLQSAFLWGLGSSFSVTVLFAIVAGDGIVGELPTMMVGFLALTAFFTTTLLFIF